VDEAKEENRGRTAVHRVARGHLSELSQKERERRDETAGYTQQLTRI
jgi:hypothetical protein